MEDLDHTAFRCCAIPDPEKGEGDKPDFDFRALAGQLDQAAGAMDGDFEFRLPELTPISNQGPLGSCVPTNAMDACEHVIAAATGRKPRQASILFNYYNDRTLMGGDEIHRDEGTHVRLAFASATQDGICPDNLWPYLTQRVFLPPTPEAYIAASSNRIAAYYKIQTFDDERLADIIHAIMDLKHPVVFGTEIGADWQAYRGVRDGDAPFTIPSHGVGRHCMGWYGVRRRAGRIALLTRNSYSRYWGLDGYGWMDQDYVRWSMTADIWVPTMVAPLRDFATT